MRIADHRIWWSISIPITESLRWANPGMQNSSEPQIRECMVVHNTVAVGSNRISFIFPTFLAGRISKCLSLSSRGIRSFFFLPFHPFLHGIQNDDHCLSLFLFSMQFMPYFILKSEFVWLFFCPFKIFMLTIEVIFPIFCALKISYRYSRFLLLLWWFW